MADQQLLADNQAAENCMFCKVHYIVQGLTAQSYAVLELAGQQAFSISNTV